ncbi:hypothetical protein BX666DRAFT_578080 [Dichotomocladium elegans]|nr:hypothetical protein BX666DRAFT_578080 [Dichotomocladium elegans]
MFDRRCYLKNIQVPYPYNLGLYRNICAALGDQPLLWFWPQRMRGNGLYFPVRLDDEEAKYRSQEDMGEFATLVERPPRLHTRASVHSNLHAPATPASVLTFATSTTLVDHHHRLSMPIAGAKDQAFEMSSR